MSAHVQIIVPKALSKAHVTQWFNCVKENVPSGLISNTQLPTSKDKKQSFYFMKRTHNGKYAYVIPLVRNLDASEVHAILKVWCETYPMGDFTFDYSQAVNKIEPVHDLVQDTKWDQILDAWGKQQHQKWLQRHADEGWSYGAAMSTKNRTHPWMQPWESLPQKARQLNLQGVQDLITILKHFGYCISQKPTG